MNVTIEVVGARNSQVLENVAEDVFDNEINSEHLATYLAEPNHMMCVAIHEGVVVGQVRALVLRHPDKSCDLYIDNLGVAPAFQRQGIATRLVAEIVRLGQERDCAEYWVGTEADNAPAVAFYRSLDLEMEPMIMFEGRLGD